MYITIKEASDKSGLSQRTIRRHIHAKTLQTEKINNAYRIDVKNFEKWIKDLNKNKNKIISSEVFITDGKAEKDKNKFVSIASADKNNYWDKPDVKGIKFADFFAGAGGLTTGFVMAGFKPIHSVEIMPEAVRTYNKNIASRFGDEILDTRDITNETVKKEAIAKLKKEKVDVIIGGFPCQGFSMAGSRVVDDPRNSLYKHLLEVVEAVKPKVVVMENVTGLRSMLEGKVEKKIIEDFQNAGYKISVETLNSADYKVPQQRKRVIFIANRMDKENIYPLPLLNSNDYVSVKDAIDDLKNKKENVDFNHEFTKHTDEMISKMSQLEEGKSLYKGYSDAWKRIRWNEPSPTVKENHGGVFIHPKQNRVMTARELARLQSFPDDFIFCGSKKWQLVQIGNAVPPLMAKAIAHSVKKMIKS